MRSCFTVRRFKIVLAAALGAVALAFCAQAIPGDSVREELIRSEAKEGLTFAWADEARDGAVHGVNFKDEKIVPLKDSRHFFGPDGISLPKDSTLLGIGACWSPDRSKVVGTFIEHPSGRVTLAVLDIASKRMLPIAIHADQKMYVTSQCWSPDGKSLLYDLDGAVRLYRIDSDRADPIAKGSDATWSPDGNWTAFRDGDIYYALRADGSERKELFRNHWGRAVSALYWSPDSRIVASVRELGFLQGGALDAELNQLRARRLEDGSDEALGPNGVYWYANYTWIKADELRRPASGTSD
jgi:WD40 repeat protein